VRVFLDAFLSASLDPRTQRIATVDARAVLGWEQYLSDDRPAVLMFRGMVEDAQKRGQIGPQSAGISARMIVSLLREATLAVMRSDEPRAAADEAAGIIDALICGLVIAPASPASATAARPASTNPKRGSRRTRGSQSTARG
jgi:hypothetical protein